MSAPPEQYPVDPADVRLTTPVRGIKGFSRPQIEGLVKMGLTNVGRLVAHLPSRHEFIGEESTIDQLTEGTLSTTRGLLTAARTAGRGRATRFEGVLHDGEARLDVVWFNQPYLAKKMHPGITLRVSGTPKPYAGGMQMANPQYEIFPEGEPPPPPLPESIIPVYPASESISSDQIRRAIDRVLDAALPQIDDHLPADFRKQKALPQLRDAYRMLHRPETDDEIATARRRLAYDELLLFQLGVHMKRAHLRDALRSPALNVTEAIDQHVRERLPFTLTPGQEHVVGEVAADLSRDRPANRLIQGDVGSGKTLVAVYAMLLSVASGHQAAIMAPTEILAEQHAASIQDMLAGSKVRIALLTGAVSAGERESILRSVESGDTDLLIGTHALLNEGVKFKSLAVAVIDEQHRFGVHQRAKLRAKGTEDEGESGTTPHVLVMTATPIPRTLALTLFGDLDVSTVKGKPPGRKPPKTRLLRPDQRDRAYQFVRSRLERGEQAYIVVPAIDTGEEGALADVRSLMHHLESGPLAGVPIASMHGRLARATREHIMARFRAGAIKALVSTTVIEVGVDVPVATVMVIEQASRFGLAQLHQLRGRVGRGGRAGVCLCIADDATPEAWERLRVFASTSDGFVLAEEDFRIRGPGEVFGTKQAGAAPFRVADLAGDLDLLLLARRDAAEWISRSPLLNNSDEQVLKRRLEKAHGEFLGLGDVA